MTNSPLLTERQAHAMLGGIGISNFRKRAIAGTIPSVRLGRRRLFVRKAIEEYVAGLQEKARDA